MVLAHIKSGDVPFSYSHYFTSCVLLLHSLRTFQTIDERRQARIAARRAAASLRTAELTPEDHCFGQNSKERREYISNVLAMQKFEEHGGDGKKHDNEATTTSPPSEEEACSDIEADEECETSQERCAICLERFEHGDDVCVSQNVECQHVSLAPSFRLVLAPVRAFTSCMHGYLSLIFCVLPEISSRMHRGMAHEERGLPLLSQIFLEFGDG